MTLTLERVQCQGLVSQTMERLRPLATQKGLSLAADLPATPIVIDSDWRALTQIIINLANNAIKFTEHGTARHGTVRLSLAQHLDGSQLVTEFSVADSGTGSRPEHQPKLFQAFSQLDSTSTRHAEGACTCARIWPDFTSNFGAGSTFTLSLRCKL